LQAVRDLPVGARGGPVAPREPMTPLLTALVAEAKKLALNVSRPQ
jgi:hypothetical protein